MTAPGADRLIAGLHRSLADVGTDPRAVAGAQAVLGFLNHDRSGEFHAAHFRAGRDLLDEGLGLLDDDAAAELRSAADSLPTEVDPRLRTEYLAGPIAQLTAVLEGVAAALLAGGLDITGLRDRVEGWERAYYAHLSAPVPAGAEGEVGTPRLDAASVQAYLRRAVPGAADVVVSSAVPLTGGFGRATVLVTMDREVFGDRELVIRAELPITILKLEGLDITTEFQVIRMAHRAGIAAPEPLLLEAGENETGTRFILMRKARGSNYGSAFGATHEISDRLVANLVAGLAQVHRVDVAEYPEEVSAGHLRDWAQDKTAADSIRRWVDLWHDYWRSTRVPSPLLARAFHWLSANVPDVTEPPRLLHSDYALGNLLIEDDQVSAVLDWEATHLGDPAEEVAWLVYSLRGQVPEDRIVDGYAAVTGLRFDPKRLRYFDVLTVVKMVACGFGAMAKFRDHPGAGPQFCLLAGQILAPFCQAVQVEIDRAENS